MRKYNVKSPKQGRNRFNSIVKMINVANLGIIYLCCNGNYFVIGIVVCFCHSLQYGAD